MDTKILIGKLNKVFCESNKADKKYSEVWLEEVDFGGLYYSDKFTLNVKAEHQIDNCSGEIRDIIKMLNESCKDELKHIWSVNVFNANEEIHCFEQFKVYSEEIACP
jgi:hypothetical protein